MIILRENEKGVTPLEMCIKIDLKHLAVDSAKSLVAYIISQFILYFFDDNFDNRIDLMKNCKK